MSLGGDGAAAVGDRRPAARWAVRAARLLVRLPPNRIEWVLRQLRRGSRPASYDDAESWRRQVVAVSPDAAGRFGCLVRSVATTLLGRRYGAWTTWCVGVRTELPFAAHAWVEAEGKLVGEPGDMDTFSRLIEVGPDTDGGEDVSGRR
ncbi:lasso peptide biosynthesis B2 protein [Nocardia carnea]|uniref:lasso peptide biosynthesis B2 protein n=1 Tax=Nocardia carnea TaxID=37328 RepID=UPI002456A2B2|nr:lasso peptide biosynthesis B2 protein [Nocardia carnea]